MSQKASELDCVPAARIHHCDAPAGLSGLIISLSRSAFLLKQKSELLYYKDCAERIRRGLEEAGEGGGWHVVVGSSFGAFVSYEAKRSCFLEVGEMKVLAFKHG